MHMLYNLENTPVVNIFREIILYGVYCIWVNRTRMDIMQNIVTFFPTLELKHTN